MVYIFACIAVGLAVFLYLQNNIIVTEEHSVDSDVNEMKIVHLSDLHSKSFGNRLYKRVAEENPDMIVVTGDLIDDDGRNIEAMLELMKRFAGVAKTIYILGNHDHRLESTAENINCMRESGVDVLIDEVKEYTIKENKIAMLGLDENQASNDNYKQRKKGTFKYRDSTEYFDKLESTEGFKLCLTHYPENFALIGEASYNKYNFDLMLCGHAHGGQFRLPLIGGLFSPGQGCFPKYCSGEFGTRPKMIVSRGLGNSRFPFRLFNYPQIIVVNIGRNLKK